MRADGTVIDVALVHRRMAVIDLADGAQPMVSARGEDTVAVVFNGCIYNHRELRKELLAAGHEFVTDHSDTEVLVHGWREWGTELPTRLDGMFAFLIWDGGRGQLFSARDRFGEKPLYFRSPGDGEPFTLAFSSTVPALRGIPAVEPEPSQEARRIGSWQTSQWIRFGYWAQPPGAQIAEVFPGFSGVTPEEPKTTGCLFPASRSTWKRWTPPGRSRTWHPAHSRFDELIGQAVSRRLDADVPVGCFLSGGVDSSLIAAHARRLRPDIKSFTVRMPDPRIDESEQAAAVAKHLGISHTVLECDPQPARDLVHLIHQLGLPFGDSSLLPSYWVCKAAAAQVKVALSGDGADELFGGYRRYRAAHFMGMLGPFRHLLRLAGPLARPDGQPDSAATRLHRFVDAAARQRYQDLVSIFPTSMHGQLGIEGFKTNKGLQAFVIGMGLIGDTLSLFHEWATGMDVWFAMSADLGGYLPGDILRKTDTASMAVPIEVRAPYLDRELVETVLRTRIRHLMPHFQRKGLLRAVARKYVPAEVVDRPKQGFAIPIGDWFRSDYGGMKQLLMDHLNSVDPWGPASLGIDLNMKFVRQMLDEHMGTGMSGRVTRDHSQRLYMLLVLSIWAKWMGSV